jgi:hypothetical protein
MKRLIAGIALLLACMKNERRQIVHSKCGYEAPVSDDSPTGTFSELSWQGGAARLHFTSPQP